MAAGFVSVGKSGTQKSVCHTVSETRAYLESHDTFVIWKKSLYVIKQVSTEMRIFIGSYFSFVLLATCQKTSFFGMLRDLGFHSVEIFGQLKKEYQSFSYFG